MTIVHRETRGERTLSWTLRDRVVAAFAQAVLVVIYLWGVGFLWGVKRFSFLCDDAFISFRYARNLTGGFGLRFNPSENPPVEGFSNLLWVLILSGVETVGPYSAFCSRALSVLCGVALVLALFRFLWRRIGLSIWCAAGACLFFVTLPPLAVWSTSGLATMPFALLVFVVFDLLIGDEKGPRPWSAGLAGILLVLLRTDGIAWAVVLGGVFAVSHGLAHRRDHVRRLVPYWIMVMAGFSALTLWRVWYFGDWMSNTAYVKVGFTGFALLRGLNYSASFVLIILSIGVVLLASLFVAGRLRGGAGFAAAMMVAATFARAILVGGDFMPFFRMFVVGLPFLAILFGYVLERMWARGAMPRIAAGVLTLACVTLSYLPARDLYAMPAAVREQFRYRYAFFRPESATHPPSELQALKRSIINSKYWSRLGRILEQVCDPSESLVASAIGALGYYSNLHMYDMGGLTDRDVARRPSAPGRHSAGHDKVVPISYFEQYKPTYAYAALSRRGTVLNEDLKSLPKLYFDREGERHLFEVYSPRVVPLPPGASLDPDEVLLLGARNVP